MELLVGLGLDIALPLAIVYVMHRWIGRYPDDWKTSSTPRREIAEALGFWLLAMIVSTTFLLSLTPDELAEPSVVMQLGFIFWTFIPALILPLGYVVFRQGWTLHDLGVQRPVSRGMVVFALGLFGLAGILPAFGGAEPMPWSFLAIALYQPAFIEEFFFRVILQGKLERALGPTRAWVWSGILFGLAHAPADFFGPQFYANGESYLNAAFLLLTQIIAGWIFGLIYAKTRSIFPGMVAHFMTDGRLGSIILHLLPA